MKSKIFLNIALLLLISGCGAGYNGYGRGAPYYYYIQDSFSSRSFDGDGGFLDALP